MAVKKRGLGRGLDALLGADVNPIAEEKNQLPQALPVEFLQRGKFQPRKDIDPESLKELAASIKTQGVIQPIVVRPVDNDKYEIIAGERRWRASQMAGLQEVPVIVRHIDDRAALAIALIENIQRQDLNVLEEAEALKRLVEEFELTHQQVADAVGKSRAMISNLLRLLDLHPEVKKWLSQNQLEMGHARALLSLPADKQVEIGDKVIKQDLTVRAVEKLIKELNNPSSPVNDKPKTDMDTLRLQQELSEKIGAKVVINHQRNGKGKLVLNYTSLEELEGIISRF
jgi:ParB family chromosome partitioning protein